jgi:hypothetical protein
MPEDLLKGMDHRAASLRMSRTEYIKALGPDRPARPARVPIRSTRRYGRSKNAPLTPVVFRPEKRLPSPSHLPNIGQPANA